MTGLHHPAPKKKAVPLRIIHGEEAQRLRTKENQLALMDSNGKVVRFPLVKAVGHGNGYVLQGVFEVQRKGHEPEIITFYKQRSYTSDLVAFAGEREIGRYSTSLAYRGTHPDYRKLGIADHAFDILEDSLAAQHAKYQKPLANLHANPLPKKKIELRTEDPGAYAFLQHRAFQPRQRVFRPGVNYLSKELGHAPEIADLEENHRVKIIGIGGKVRYWSGKVRLPKL